MKRISFLLLCCLLVPATALGADKDGRFAVKGAGLGNCQAFVAAHKDKTNAYFVFGGWLDGYMTAVNKYSSDTFDIVSWESTELLAALINNHCQKNPNDNYFRVVDSMLVLLKEDRLRESSPLVSAEVDDRTVKVYRSTLRRIQLALRDLGHYDGAVDGQFGPKTQAAIAAYQKSQGMEPSGLPLQLTLLKLLRPSSGETD